MGYAERGRLGVGGEVEDGGGVLRVRLVGGWVWVVWGGGGLCGEVGCRV